MKIAGALTAIVLVLLVAFVAFMVYVGSDTLSSGATGSEVLSPSGTSTGKALVVYNPGLSGAPRDAATQIANDLKARGYEVMLAGVKSAAAANVSGYDVIVAGGPIYGGKVSPSIESYLRELVPPANAKVGAFAIGGSTGKPFPDAAWLKATTLFPSGSGIDRQRAAFLAELLK
jgi:flavodoxin